MRSLARLLQHNVLGQTARFERFAAGLLFKLAAGQKIDPEKSEPFSAQVETIYSNPFEEQKKAEPMTAAEIKSYLLEKMKARLHGG